MNWNRAKGDAAACLRQRKFALLRDLQIPPDALPTLFHQLLDTGDCAGDSFE
jgi:hypothetical protein